MSVVLGFFAYSSHPELNAETVRAAVELINASALVSLKSWEDCRVGGLLVADTICSEIRVADLFCADLTGMNPNVMFEIGFAIASGKRLWPVLDDTRADAKSVFDQIKLLSTVGYAKYRNAPEISAAFHKDRPHEDLANTLLETAIRPNLQEGSQDTLLYLKSLHDTDASIRVTRLAQNSTYTVVVDDPSESGPGTLTWYGVHAFDATAVLCHLTGSDREGARIQNARHSLVAGMAVGFGRPLLILTEGPVLAPLDYRDMVRQYSTAGEATRIVERWLRDREADRRERERSRTSVAAKVRLALELKTLRLGEYIAENETVGLPRYFVETAAYREALSGRGGVFVGRKGAGKTANLIKLEEDRNSAALGLEP